MPMKSRKSGWDSCESPAVNGRGEIENSKQEAQRSVCRENWKVGSMSQGTLPNSWESSLFTRERGFTLRTVTSVSERTVVRSFSPDKKVLESVPVRGAKHPDVYG